MILQVNNLSKSFDKKIVVNIPFLAANKGDILGIVGNNGAGKTTLFRLLIDLLRTDSGNVTIFNKDVSESEEWKSYTGSFIDNSFLIECLSPEEYFAFIGNVYQIKEDDIRNRLSTYTAFMHDEILHQKKYIRNFSAGNKQKIGIIGAMLINPQILILDEPFNFLDPSSQIEMKRLLHRMNEESDTTILISSHNLNHITDISTHILLMEKGKIIKNIDNSRKEAIYELEDYFKITDNLYPII
ncbi:MAG: ABC transporter ATP-binding protein [Dysgonamonadaceae bacterium]|jgi:ABC-2 type transport system ATP-binding protein|nr:ABC transporter ATP-binding protein [Dysgonamonadaceae bacterium]